MPGMGLISSGNDVNRIACAIVSFQPTKPFPSEKRRTTTSGFSNSWPNGKTYPLESFLDPKG